MYKVSKMQFPKIDRPIHFIASIIVIVGAIAWLQIGLFQRNFVKDIFGVNDKYVYDIVGLAGIYLAICKIMWLSGMKPLPVMMA
jgi:uncharacterized membrane protein YuzA (DUF378 family)